MDGSSRKAESPVARWLRDEVGGVGRLLFLLWPRGRDVDWVHLARRFLERYLARRCCLADLPPKLVRGLRSIVPPGVLESQEKWRAGTER